ncbi:MAG: zinc ribbon domain-containing protein [Oscillospiraceae bacterium]
MDFLENVRIVLENATKVVVKKSGEIIDSSKIKYAIFDLNSDIKKLYSEIGEAVYNSRYTDADASDKVEELCQSIKEKQDEIIKLGIRLDDINDSVACPSCGKSCKIDTNFCPYCGGEIAVTVNAEVNRDTDDTFKEDEYAEENVKDSTSDEN